MQNEILAELRNAMPKKAPARINDTASHTGNWAAVQLFGAQFPDNATDVEIVGDGVNMSDANLCAHGVILHYNFTKIKLTGGALHAIPFRKATT